MRFLHNTIQSSQKANHCLSYSVDIENKKLNYFICVFSGEIQVFNIESNLCEPIVNFVGRYPLSVEISYITLIGMHLAVVTTDCSLLMLKNYPPFKLVSKYQMSSLKDPLRIPLAHFAITCYGEFMLSSGFMNNAIVCQFDSDDTPTLKTINMPDFIIIGIAPTHEPECFKLLVSHNEKKKLISINITEDRLVDEIDLPCEYHSLLTVFDSEGTGKQLIFSDKTILVDEKVFNITSPMNSYCVTKYGEVLIQLFDQNVYVFDPNRMIMFPRGKLPLVSMFCFMDNGFLFCFSQYGNSYFLPLSQDSSLSNSSIGLDMLPKTTFSLMPTISNAFMFMNTMYTCVGSGDDSQIVSIINSVPHTTESISFQSDILASKTNWLTISESNYVGQNAQFFYCPPNIHIITSKGSSSLLSGSCSIHPSQTYALGKFGDVIYQVHSCGVLGLDNDKKWPDYSIVIDHASMNKNHLVLCTNGSHLLVLDPSFRVVSERDFPGFKQCLICDDNIAVLTKAKESQTSLLAIYNTELSDTESFTQIQFPVFSMAYVPSICSIFISTSNGSVFVFSFSSTSLSRNMTLIYESKYPSYLIGFQNSVLMASDKFRFFSNNCIYDLKEPMKPICIAYENEGSFRVLTSDKTILSITAQCKDMIDISKESFNVSICPRKIITTEKYVFVIMRQSYQNVTRSSLLYINKTNPNQKYEIVTSNRDVLVSIASINDNSIICGIERPDGKGSYLFLDLDDNGTKVSQAQYDLPAPSYAVAVKNSIVYISSGRELYQVENQNQTKSIFFSKTQIAFLEIGDKFIWIGDRTQSVFVCRIQNNNSSGSSLKPLVACDISPCFITAMKLLDEYTVVIGDKFGNITVLKLSDDVITNKIWRTSTPPERGINIDSCSRLDRIANICLNQTITSIMIPQFSKCIFYTTLHGQIGSMIPLSSDEEFNTLLSVENQTEKACSEKFGFIQSKTVDISRLCVANGDMILMLENLDQDSQIRIEQGLKLHPKFISNHVSKLKLMSKF